MYSHIFCSFTKVIEMKQGGEIVVDDVPQSSPTVIEDTFSITDKGDIIVSLIFYYDYYYYLFSHFDNT